MRTVRAELVFIGIIAAVVFMANLGSGSLNSWDEGFYAGVSREIVKTGDWIHLRWSGSPWSDKPPLYMWITAALFKTAGINEFSVRFFSALSGIGTVILVYLLGLRLYGRKEAFAAGLVLLSTWHFILIGRQGMLDVPLTFFAALSVYLFVIRERWPKALFFLPVAIALAFMTKSIAAFFIPIVIILYMAAAKDISVLKDRKFILGLAVAAALVLWWHVMVYMKYGQSFIDGYFLKHFVTRTREAVDGHSGGLMTYFNVISNKGRPWGTAGLVMIPIMIYRVFVKKEKAHLIPLLWAAALLVLYSPQKTKLHWYIMPVYPALALMAGWGLARLSGRYAKITAVALAAVAILYLAGSKHIFAGDYSPQVKNLSRDIREKILPGEKLHLWGIGDPGLQFYLGDIGDNVNDDNIIKKELNSGKYYILTVINDPLFKNTGARPIMEKNGYTLYSNQ
ncbi:MAG: glycosyltransferase family 39 protein [Candidatus Omnitrophica bacterium]|nr:glycosyltransferase family 39 protein [Candidatus Omnitrophota bacterium]